jgi:hypothetical protein
VWTDTLVLHPPLWRLGDVGARSYIDLVARIVPIHSSVVKLIACLHPANPQLSALKQHPEPTPRQARSRFRGTMGTRFF